MKFSGKKIIAAKSGNILPYFKVNLSDSQTLPLNRNFQLYLTVLSFERRNITSAAGKDDGTFQFF